MLEKIIDFSVKNKLIIILFTLTIAAFGIYVVFHIPVGAVPDITNNQVQVITTSGNLSTQEIEQFITAPVEMEMANLPGVKEIRSVSKFGISVVTIVFDEQLGTYLPRQLIEEKIKSAQTKIPQGYGIPEMGPISTGLGEIYQYIVDVKPGYEKLYSPMELRTIQDWVIKRRLSGINGVVEINSWGGYLKQYEVAVSPSRLAALEINILEVLDALEKNNSISGGSYIEKTNQSYFIRGDGRVNGKDDIENIVVKNLNGKPLYIKDVATVQFGHANRFGAITANGKGETVLGQIMMLKNANSKEVIQDVKDRVAEIQKNLPEGVFINPILERSELIGKTSFTVAENLILGALIVMLTVILLLGNLRSALVIASMIPLALLFTISMMFIFGIDANLMSLGALDFGIIIDGAVIIVEFIAIKLSLKKDNLQQVSGDEKQLLMDKIASEGSSKMMKSAIFGQIIILIVFIPILSLSGVEGKMFRPMALSFSFAILGAMILGLTWLPVASSLFLRPEKHQKRNLSDWFMDRAYLSYLPSIRWALNHKKSVLLAAVASLVLTIFLFSRMGGEFVPTLDEGDFVIQPVLKTGTSLSKTIEMTTRMENILLEKFPDEVHQIVSRIGAAEVPTDPMSMEEIDMIIKLKPKREWKAAKSKEELAEIFKKELEIIPGIEYEFTQPIEMRFNELITGVRSDIAIKVYGEDLNQINNKALEIKNLIENVPGAGDIILEKTTGLPQIKIDYNRQRIARYGMDIESVNAAVATAFGGETCGNVFEGEKRFDLVVRLDDQDRKDIENIRELKIPIGNGTVVPLSELASISYSEGPAKISRDNTHRRVVVSVNVRNRDLQSVIEDIQSLIDQKLTLDPGTYIEYGGQFENLQNASKRLMIAVPIALLLIFIFLHFAFKSMKDAALIFTSIPLATVGGVLLLWIRGMPFSVSAGVGFIALFGIAVLNGIVLIEHLKELQHKHFDSMRELIIEGTKNRLRPVMLTAGAAAMGFLPMAISSGAGAEVQRPLATVVIGGLFTSTLLTMIALPILFEIFYSANLRRVIRRRPRIRKALPFLLLVLIPAFSSHAQTKPLNLEQCIAQGLANNASLKAMQLRIEESQWARKATFSPGKTNILYSFDENNIAENGYPLQVFSIQQNFDFPTVYTAGLVLADKEIKLAELKHALSKNALAGEIATVYFDYQLACEKILIYKELDTLYRTLFGQEEIRTRIGESPKLEELTMQAQVLSLKAELSAATTDKRICRQRLLVLLNAADTIQFDEELVRLPASYAPWNPDIYKWMNLNEDKALAEYKAVRQSAMPGFSLNYFIGSNRYAGARQYNGFELGVALPLFYWSDHAKQKSAWLASQAVKEDMSQLRREQDARLAALIAEQERLSEQLDNYYFKGGRNLENELLRMAFRSYETGAVNFAEFVTSLEAARKIKLSYLENLAAYNKLTSSIHYYTF